MLSKVRLVLVDDVFLERIESFVCLHVIQFKSCCSEVKAHELTLCWR
jgi:hypothetical protein